MKKTVFALIAALLITCLICGCTDPSKTEETSATEETAQAKPDGYTDICYELQRSDGMDICECVKYTDGKETWRTTVLELTDAEPDKRGIAPETVYSLDAGDYILCYGGARISSYKVNESDAMAGFIAAVDCESGEILFSKVLDNPLSEGAEDAGYEENWISAAAVKDDGKIDAFVSTGETAEQLTRTTKVITLNSKGETVEERALDLTEGLDCVYDAVADGDGYVIAASQSVYGVATAYAKIDRSGKVINSFSVSGTRKADNKSLEVSYQRLDIHGENVYLTETEAVPDIDYQTLMQENANGFLEKVMESNYSVLYKVNFEAGELEELCRVKSSVVNICYSDDSFTDENGDFCFRVRLITGDSVFYDYPENHVYENAEFTVYTIGDDGKLKGSFDTGAKARTYFPLVIGL